MAARLNLTRQRVARWRDRSAAYGMKPHLSRTFKLSNDKHFLVLPEFSGDI